MHVIPVLDLLDGVVVRGVAGRRSEYRPVESCLTASIDPLSVARAFRNELGLTQLYIADLDAILHRRPNLAIYRELTGDGFQVLVDAGLRDAADAEGLVESGAAKVIAGLETWTGPDELGKLVAQLGTDRVIFSLDLKHGVPEGRLATWNTSDPYEIGCRAVQCGICEMIVLDVAQVGQGAGVTTTTLCRRLLESYPQLSIITGGGVRSATDLHELRELGVAGALVASALHNGRIGRREITDLIRLRA